MPQAPPAPIRWLAAANAFRHLQQRTVGFRLQDIGRELRHPRLVQRA